MPHKTVLIQFVVLAALLSPAFGKVRPPAVQERQAFTLGSKSFQNNGSLPKLYTCDSLGISPALSWANVPEGTASIALTMHHFPKDGDKHVYLVMYDIPAETTGIPDGVSGIGRFGVNTVNRRPQYTPPCSKGPGAKNYIITAYALSSPPGVSMPSAAVTMDVLLNAIQQKTLATAVLTVNYARPF